jgi:hypothetical protein
MSALRRTVFAVAAFAGMAALATSPALAQAPPGPPVCGSVASLMNLEIWGEGFGALGDNFISIPAISPVNNQPPPSGGFSNLCTRFGIPSGGASLIQFQANTGGLGTQTFICGQAPSAVYSAGQAVLIRPTVGPGGALPPGSSSTGRIPGVECSQPYTSYGEGLGAIGDNLYPVPLTIVLTPVGGGGSPEDLCLQLNLPAGSSVQDFVAGPTSNIRTHLCTQTPTFGLRIGQGVLIRPTGTPGAAVATGQPIIF